MKKSFSTFLWLLFVATLMACTSNAASDNQQIVQSTAPAFILPTSTIQVTPTIGLLPPTIFAAQDSIKNTPELSSSQNYIECSTGWSSEVRGNWALCNGFANPITIMSASGKIWQFSYNSYYGKDFKNLCTRLHHITRDETFLYFSLDPDCELFEPGFIFSISMFRMNLLDGKVTEALNTFYNFEANDDNYYSISISPTGRRMAYIYPQQSPLTLNVLDMQTGENNSFPLDVEYTSGGMFSWSEDGTKLVFMLESEKDYEYLISMIFLDLTKRDSMVTFIHDKDHLWISSKVEISDNGVTVSPIDSDPLFYDIATGILSPASK